MHVFSLLQTHEKVSLRLHSKFAAVVDRWREKNVTPEQEKACEMWLMGKVSLRSIISFLLALI